jgi:hypothetical protein
MIDAQAYKAGRLQILDERLPDAQCSTAVVDDNIGFYRSKVNQVASDFLCSFERALVHYRPKRGVVFFPGQCVGDRSDRILLERALWVSGLAILETEACVYLSP